MLKLKSGSYTKEQIAEIDSGMSRMEAALS